MKNGNRIFVRIINITDLRERKNRKNVIMWKYFY